MLGNSLVPASRKQSKALEAHQKDVDLQVAQAVAEMNGRQTVVEHALNINSMVVSHAAANEMQVAEYMVARAGASPLAQAIAADRINRLMHADNRTLSQGGF